MNIKEYIESGILADYVLNAVSEQERQEVECMAKIYPEIKSELQAHQSALQEYVGMHNSPPPAQLKHRIFASIEKLPTHIPQEKAKAAEKNTFWPYYAAAASLALLLFTTYLYITYTRQSDLLRQQLNIAENQQQIMREQLAQITRKLEILANPEVLRIKLSGLPEKDTSAFVMLLWNPANKDLYIDQTRLSPLPTDKQYQLWALHQGVPIDMGVFDVGAHAVSDLIKMKPVEAADAFAITVEKRGGVPSPTLSEMVVLGKICI